MLTHRGAFGNDYSDRQGALDMLTEPVVNLSLPGVLGNIVAVSGIAVAVANVATAVHAMIMLGMVS